MTVWKSNQYIFGTVASAIELFDFTSSWTDESLCTAVGTPLNHSITFIHKNSIHLVDYEVSMRTKSYRGLTSNGKQPKVILKSRDLAIIFIENI